MTRPDDHDLVLDLFDELDEPDRRRLTEALAGSSELRSRRERYAAMVEELRALPQEPPPVFVPPAVAVETNTAGRRLLPLAAAVALAVLALLVGRTTRDPALPEPRTAEVETLSEQVAILTRRLDQLARKQARAADRVAVIERLTPAAGQEAEAAAAIGTALLRDPSANVRLAALDALYVEPGMAPSAGEIGQALRSEPEVALRLAWVSWIATARPTGWADLLEQAAADPSPVVRSRAKRVLGGVL